MKHAKKFLVLIIIYCTISTSFSQVPLSICQITNFPVNEMEIITVGTVTEIVSDDEFMLTAEGCSVLCDGELNELPWIGNEILIVGVIEYESIGNDLEIDTDYWLLIEDGGDPPPDPPAVVFTVEDAISSPVGTIAGLSGEVTEYIDEVTGFASFMDSTGSMNMDFSANDLPDVQQLIHVLGVVEYGEGAPSQIDVFQWYYDGGNPPPDPPPVAWYVVQADSLPVGTYCFLFGEVTSWTNEIDGEGIFTDGDNSMNIDFEEDVEVLPGLGVPFYVLGKTGENLGVKEIEGHHWFEDWITSADDLLEANIGIQIYPNPAENIIKIYSGVSISRIMIWNAKGELMKDINRFETSAINVSDLIAGVYIISIINENKHLTNKKLIKK